MKMNELVQCKDFSCADIVKEAYLVPPIDIDPENINIVMISEVSPLDTKEYFYAPANPFYLQTTLQAFNDAGTQVSSIEDIIKLGIYITTAVKCAKTQYSISSETITKCSTMLEKELALFPNVKALMLMGDVAIKSVNSIAKRDIGKAVIPSDSTYKIRKNQFYYRDIRVFPSYIMTGKNFLIEKSKRRMISEDIREAIKLAE